MKPVQRQARCQAKPTAGWSTMNRVQLVLMKKGDGWAGESPMVGEGAPAADLQKKYRDMYKHPLPDKFVAAITELIDATGGPGKKVGHRSLLPEPFLQVQFVRAASVSQCWSDP